MSTCGIDEVGRGCLAGRVHACAVVFHDEPPEGIRDSKALSPRRRSELDEAIRAVAHVSIGTAEVDEIDRLNILRATMLAMERARRGLPGHLALDAILVDGDRSPSFGCGTPTRAVVRGDATVLEIAAASICAKVARDAEMDALHRDHPGYAWDRNRGYGTADHLRALSALGPTPHHRMTFAPLRQPTLALAAGADGGTGPAPSRAPRP